MKQNMEEREKENERKEEEEQQEKDATSSSKMIIIKRQGKIPDRQISTDKAHPHTKGAPIQHQGTCVSREKIDRNRQHYCFD